MRRYHNDGEDDGFSMPEFIGRFIPPIMARVSGFQALSKLTESPIETILGLALIEALPSFYGSRWSVCLPAEVDEADSNFALLIPQYPWRRWRMDWLLKVGDVHHFIECDGAEFHSTREQMANDAAKDEAILAAGHRVSRFTGSYISKLPDYCALDVLRETRVMSA